MSSPADYSFTRRPVWLIGHMVVMVAVVGFVLLGMWQLRRHEERSVLDDRLTSRLEESPVPIDELLATTAGVDEIEFRPVSVTGRYLTSEEVILRARSHEGASGHEVLTPLETAEGTAVVVDRGWVPIDADDPPVAEATPPAGEVTVTGFLRLTQEREGIGPTDPAEGELERISRVDLDRLSPQIEAPLAPVWVQLASQEPSQRGRLPLTVPPPQPGEGPPHLAYAVQWFVFAAIAAVGYPILVRRTARSQPAPG